MEEAAQSIEGELRTLADPARAAKEKSYLKSDLEHLGVSVPATRRVAQARLRAHPQLTARELSLLVDELWAVPVHERRMCAALMLQARSDLVDGRQLPQLERLLRESRTWAIVDVLAGDVVGALVAREPARAGDIEPWLCDPDLWMRRSLLLAQRRSLIEGAPIDRFAGYADALLDEREFFVRKAIGWVLRDLAKRRPDEVYEWLAPRTSRASGVTMREAVRYLPAPRRQALMTAYREGRPMSASPSPSP